MEKTKSSSKKFRRLIQFVIISMAGAVLAVLIHNIIAFTGERYEERNTPRIDDTKYAVGTEILDLEPASGQTSKGAVLLVHGFIGGSSNFGALPELLAADGWNVRALRLPGHGTTPRDFAKQTPESLLKGVRAELAELNKEHDRVHIVGHSMGGALTTHVASMDEVSSIVLASPAFGVAHQWYYGLRPETWTQVLTPIVPWVYKGDLFKQVNRKGSKPDIISYTWVPTRGLVCLQNVSAAASTPEVLSKVTCPVLMIHGRGDVAASYDKAVKVYQSLGTESKKLVTLENSNHHIFWDFESVQVCEGIVEFLD